MGETCVGFARGFAAAQPNREQHQHRTHRVSPHNAGKEQRETNTWETARGEMRYGGGVIRRVVVAFVAQSGRL